MESLWQSLTVLLCAGFFRFSFFWSLVFYVCFLGLVHPNQKMKDFASVFWNPSLVRGRSLEQKDGYWKHVNEIEAAPRWSGMPAVSDCLHKKIKSAQTAVGCEIVFCVWGGVRKKEQQIANSISTTLLRLLPKRIETTLVFHSIPFLGEREWRNWHKFWNEKRCFSGGFCFVLFGSFEFDQRRACSPVVFATVKDLGFGFQTKKKFEARPGWVAFLFVSSFRAEAKMWRERITTWYGECNERKRKFFVLFASIPSLKFPPNFFVFLFSFGFVVNDFVSSCFILFFFPCAQQDRCEIGGPCVCRGAKRGIGRTPFLCCFFGVRPRASSIATVGREYNKYW